MKIDVSKIKVLIREAEQCFVCRKEFLSLYPITKCSDHETLEEVER